MKIAHLFAGVDEAGRGPLAGPVVAGAVILDPNHPIEGLMDSKKLTASKREALFDMIYAHALSVGVGQASIEEIDEINILQASLLAMRRAVEDLHITPSHAQVDGNKCPQLLCSVEAIVKGDSKIPAISAASIIAKVTRDQMMAILDATYPMYGFAQHKGYPTKKHLVALDQHGVCPVHRRSYAPVRDRLVTASA